MKKRILITGFFVKNKRIIHGKEDYFERLIDYMSKHHGFLFDIKNVRPWEAGAVKLSLPPGCTQSYLESHLGRYRGFPNFRCIFLKKDRNICLNLTKRQLLQYPIPPSKYRTPIYFISAGIALRRVTNELRRLNPSLIICFNRETPINALLNIIAKKLLIPILFVEGGILPGTIEFDSVGNEALSWPVRHLNKFNQLEISEEEKNRTIKFFSFLRKNNISRKTQRSEELDKILDKTKINRSIIFFAGSNERGTSIYFKDSKTFNEISPFFSGNKDALNYLIELAEQLDWLVIFKPHPNETDSGINYNIKNPRLHILEHANIFNLIDISDVTITITSGISGISLIHGKPSILLGKNGLFGKGATYDLEKKENLGVLIERAIRDGFTENMQKKWLEYATRTIKYYNFSFGTDIEEYIGRGVEDASQLLVDYLQEERRKNMFI